MSGLGKFKLCLGVDSTTLHSRLEQSTDPNAAAGTRVLAGIAAEVCLKHDPWIVDIFVDRSENFEHFFGLKTLFVLLASDDESELGWIRLYNPAKNIAGIKRADGSYIPEMSIDETLLEESKRLQVARLKIQEAEGRQAFSDSNMTLQDIDGMSMSQLAALWDRYGLSRKYLESRDAYKEDACSMMPMTVVVLSVAKCSSAEVVISCASIAGSQWMEIRVRRDAEMTIQALLTKLANQLGKSTYELALVLPSGRRIESVDFRSSSVELLELE